MRLAATLLRGTQTRMGKPTVTIGVPVYNGARFLCETLESLVAQTFDDLEVVISDNGSTDDTEAICRAFAARDDRIRYYRNPSNYGAAANYNRLVDLARGELFRWNAADDFCSPDALEKCVRALRADPDAVLAYPTTRIVDEQSQVIREYDDRLELLEPVASARLKSAVRRTHECNAVFGLMRASTLRRTERIGRYIGSDVVLLAELSLYGTFRQVEDAFFFRRDHAAASSADKTVRGQMAFFDPRSKQRVSFRRWKHLCEYARAVMRAPLAPTEVVQCLAVLGAHVITNRVQLARELIAPLR